MAKKMKTIRLDDSYIGRMEGIRRMLNETGIVVNDSTIFRSVLLAGMDQIENKLNSRLDNEKGNLAQD